MEASELRIGNYIYDDENNLSKVNGFKPFDTSVRCDEEEGCVITIDIYNHVGISEGYECDSNYIKPIVLTKEILLKCGFKRFPWGLVISKLLFKDDLKCNYLELEIGNGFRVKIKYLHQLQNLYFALNGEELIVNL